MRGAAGEPFAPLPVRSGILRALVARLLFLILVPLQIWMFVDAVRRRADTYWLWIIVGVPGGALLYLFLVRLRDRDAQRLTQRLLTAVKRPESVERLRFRYAETPTIAARLVLAQALGDAGEWAEAREHFAGVLARRPEEHDALFGLGVCALELGDPQAARVAFEQLAEVHAGYRDFALYPELAEAYEKLGEPERSLELLRDLARREPRLAHVVLLAERLMKHRHRPEARDRLRAALRAYEDAAPYVRRSQRPWARRADALLRELREPAS